MLAVMAREWERMKGVRRSGSGTTVKPEARPLWSLRA